MKKIFLTAFVLSVSLWMAQAVADSAIKSADEVQGSWKLDHTKKSISSKEDIPREDTWVFKDKTVTILHIPREGTYYDQSPVGFDIEDGKLKISLLGRSDKFDIFTLVEKTDTSMTLKGKFGDMYFFNKK